MIGSYGRKRMILNWILVVGGRCVQANGQDRRMLKTKEAQAAATKATTPTATRLDNNKFSPVPLCVLPLGTLHSGFPLVYPTMRLETSWEIEP
jgi:hypothetical protein